MYGPGDLFEDRRRGPGGHRTRRQGYQVSLLACRQASAGGERQRPRRADGDSGPLTADDELETGDAVSGAIDAEHLAEDPQLEGGGGFLEDNDDRGEGHVASQRRDLYEE